MSEERHAKVCFLQVCIYMHVSFTIIQAGILFLRDGTLIFIWGGTCNTCMYKNHIPTTCKFSRRKMFHCSLPHNFNAIILSQVLWKRLYKKGNTFTERCTLPQLQSLINRSNVPLNPKSNVNAAEDFIEVCSEVK